MTEITVDEIQRDPVGFVHRIEAGEPLLVMRDNVAIAEVFPIPPTPTAGSRRR